MTPSTLAAIAVDLNTPGRYLHWNVFTVSVSNLVLILAMVAIFGLALLLPFPGKHGPEDGDADAGGDAGSAAEDAPEAAAPRVRARSGPRPWTAVVRTAALRTLGPDKLLPDRQPAYVASWVYVFGVATLAALGMVIASGLVLAIGGADWWHVNSVGHFVNSLHLWSVEMFMAFMVIHLWGKFWMAAWRGKRSLTWMTGVIAFIVSILEAFTGYLSQQNFDSQWIAANGKDAMNAVGVGAYFNLLNFGQMFMWHIALVPLILVALVGLHVVLVRMRGVSHPLPVTRAADRSERIARRRADGAAWSGPTRRYDIIKEGAIATVIVLVMAFVLAGVLSSPDEPPVTVGTWARLAPADFLGTAASELNGSSLSAGYGPPYNHGSNNVQTILFTPQLWPGVTQPLDTANAFVLDPLRKVAPTNAAIAAAITRYDSAPSATRQAWADAYVKAVADVTFDKGQPVVPAADDGPVPLLLSEELTLARSGALDADLIAEQPFYGTNYTKPILFLGDGEYFANKAQAQGLTGPQWGEMNETGSYPGQPWLWLYTLWYQLPGFRSSSNADLIAIYMTGVGTALLLLVPFIPGLRDVPRAIPIHRLVWRRWNREVAAAGGSGGPDPGGAAES